MVLKRTKLVPEYQILIPKAGNISPQWFIYHKTKLSRVNVAMTIHAGRTYGMGNPTFESVDIANATDNSQE